MPDFRQPSASELKRRIGVRLGTMACAAALAAAAQPASSEITRIVIDSRLSLGAVHDQPEYELLRGRLFGAIDPKLPQNAIIQDIALAPRDAMGKVEYISTFTLLRPSNRKDANRILLVEVPNRGNRISPFGEQNETEAFLRRYGYSAVWIGWQGDLPERPDSNRPATNLKLESLLAPRATGPRGAPLTGRYLVRIPTSIGPGPQGDTMRIDQGGAGPLAYFPDSFDQSHATLTGGPPEDARGNPTGARYAIPSTDWKWWNCRDDAEAPTAKTPGDLCIRRMRGLFESSQSYTFAFTVRDPLVLGLGLAATRDASAFFRRATVGRTGDPNPLAGMIDYVIGQGVSQVGNFTKTFVLLGFNRDEHRRIVWDGLSDHIAGRLTPLNYRFSTPGSSPTLYQPGSEGTLWWGKATNPIRGGKPASLLDRCSSTNSCPKVMETFGATELWNQRMTAGLVTLDLKHDIPLPPNVRRYYFPGTTHGGGSGAFTTGAVAPPQSPCSLPMNPNPEDAQMRALFIAFTRWIVDGRAPPASRYPRLADGTLVRDESGGLHPLPWPNAPQPFGLANPLLVYDYGTAFRYADESGLITKLPPAILAVVPALVAQTDADGNETAGVPSVQLSVPLGTYLGWNTYRSGPYAGRICSLNGAFVPFAATKEARLSAGDPRLSLEERYGSRAAFMTKITDAADREVSARFLLPEDRDALLSNARKFATEGGFAPPS
jgi:hypothetical protein